MLPSGQVPKLWSRVAYPSLKPLASWFKDYHARVAFMRAWLEGGVPKCFWLPGFFFPQVQGCRSAVPACSCVRMHVRMCVY